jgi:hypothetical protein
MMSTQKLSRVFLPIRVPTARLLSHFTNERTTKTIEAHAGGKTVLIPKEQIPMSRVSLLCTVHITHLPRP